MSAEINRLPGFIIADLFRNNLVDIEDNSTAKQVSSKTEKPAVKKQWYFGDNKKNICIIVADPAAVYLDDKSLQFLSAILGACKLHLGDVAIINLHQQAKNYEEIKGELSPKYILLFDILTTKVNLPFAVPNYQVQTFDQCRFLSAPALHIMMGENQEAKLEKSKLWLSLQKLFAM